MTKSDLIKAIADKTKLSQKDTEATLKGMIEVVTATLAKKDAVELIGFGKFEIALQKGKTGKVPGTNKTYSTKDKYVPKFKAGKGLKDAVAKVKVK